MKYFNYHLNIESITKVGRKAKLTRQKGQKAIKDVLGHAYGQLPFTTMTLDFIIQAEEFNWMQTGKTVYYPADLDLAQSMQRASATIAEPSAFFEDNETFMLNFPAGVIFAGKQASGCMVTVCNHKMRGEEFLIPYAKFCDVALPKINDTLFGSFSISCCYQEHGGNENEYMRFCITSDMIQAFFQSKSCEDWDVVMNEINDFNFLGGALLDAPNRHYQYEIMQFILNFLLYKKALPERIREGLPGIGRKEAETPYFNHRTHHTIKAPKTDKAAPELHYRSWHFRQLSHERFYKGEYAHLEPGSRVVFVSDSMVGDATPLTVES